MSVQLKIPFKNSMNPSPEVLRICYLQADWEMINRTRRLDGLRPIDHSDVVRLRAGKTVHEWLNSDFSRFEYYKFVSKYNNNFKVNRNFYKI